MPILIVLCGISGSTDVKPVFRKVYLKTKKMTNISQAQTGSKAVSRKIRLCL